MGLEALRKADVGGERGLAAAASDFRCRAAIESGSEEGEKKKRRTPTKSMRTSRVVMPPRPRDVRLMAMVEDGPKIFV